MPRAVYDQYLLAKNDHFNSVDRCPLCACHRHVFRFDQLDASCRGLVEESFTNPESKLVVYDGQDSTFDSLTHLVESGFLNKTAACRTVAGIRRALYFDFKSCPPETRKPVGQLEREMMMGMNPALRVHYLTNPPAAYDNNTDNFDDMLYVRVEDATKYTLEFYDKQRQLHKRYGEERHIQTTADHNYDCRVTWSPADRHFVEVQAWVAWADARDEEVTNGYVDLFLSNRILGNLLSAYNVRYDSDQDEEAEINIRLRGGDEPTWSYYVVKGDRSYIL